MKKKYIFFTLTAILLGGCYKNYTFDIGEENVRPVLNALLRRDSVVRAYVSLSSPKDVYMLNSRTDAIVKLYIDGTFREQLQLRQDGAVAWFESTAPIDPTSTYKITADINGFQEVSGEDVIPPLPPQIDASIKIVETPPNLVPVRLKFRIHDKAGEKNYYRIRMFRIIKGYDGTIKKIGPLEFEKDGSQEWELFGEDWMSEILVDDAFFDGRSAQFLFRSRHSGYDEPFELEVTQLTRECYQYFRSSKLQRERRSTDIAEKVIVHGNIQNGLGIVGGMSTGYITIMPER